MMQESSAWRLYTGSEVIDTERLWWAAWGFGRAPPQGEAAELRSAWQSGESADEAPEMLGEDEEEEDEDKEKDSDTLL